MFSWLNASGRMPGVAFAFSMCRRNAIEHKAIRLCLLADRKGHQQYAISIILVYLLDITDKVHVASCQYT